MIKIVNLNDYNEPAKPGEVRIYCGRGSIFGNPYTHLDLKKTMAKYRCKTREEAIEKYSVYFDIMYNGNLEFQKAADELYEHYKNGDDIVLECFCYPQPCHCEIIKKKMEKRFFKEKIRKIKFQNESIT